MASSGSLFSFELNVIGVLTVLWLFLKIVFAIGWVVRVHVLSDKWKGVDVASYGPWAVVTGATSGVGKGYAHELAKRGLNVVLISRSLEKLKQVAAEIEQQHGRNTKVIQTDFFLGSESYEPIRAALQGLEVGVLVNNVGITGHQLGPFLTYTNLDEYINNAVNCNILSVAKMTQILLPQMVARKKGIIINLSSFTGERPFPFNLLYGATKTFDDFFSQGLEMEYGSKGIIVQTLTPLFIDTRMAATIPKLLKVTTEDYARQALNAVGLTSRTSGCLKHSIQKFFVELVAPIWLHLFAAGTKPFESLMAKM